MRDQVTDGPMKIANQTRQLEKIWAERPTRVLLQYCDHIDSTLVMSWGSQSNSVRSPTRLLQICKTGRRPIANNNPGCTVDANHTEFGTTLHPGSRLATTNHADLVLSAVLSFHSISKRRTLVSRQVSNMAPAEARCINVKRRF